MSSLKFACPHCEQHLEAPEEFLGQTVQCPTCKQSLTLSKATVITAEEKTRVCEWCAKTIPEESFKCPFCHKWRNEIHEVRQRIIVYLVICIATAIGSFMALNVAVRSIIRSTPYRFRGGDDITVGEFLSSDDGGIAFLLLIGAFTFAFLIGRERRILKKKYGLNWTSLFM